MPPLTPEQLGELSVRFEKLTRDLEEDLLRDIARRIAKAGTVTDTAEYQILRMKEMGYATDYIEKALAEYTEKSEQEIEQIFFDAGQCSDEFYSRAYAAAGKPFRPVSENPYMQQLIRAGIEQTKGELHNYTRSMGFSERGPDGGTRFKPAAKAYQDALDLAHMQVASGVFDYNTAVRNAARPLTDSGLRYVDYASGHVNHADVAVRRAVLTGVSQMTGKIAEHNMKELGTDLVEVTAHAGARPDHAVWQGKWYSYSGSSKKYPSLAEATKYGCGDGLKGWNCRHDFYPVIEGIDTPAYTEEELRNIDPPPIEYNGRTYTYYECTQKQRQMETAMRKTKREVAAAQGTGDNEMFTVKSILLRRQREEYAKFSDRAGLLTQNERHQVYGFDRSLAAKSTAAAKKALDKSAGSGIIKTKNNDILKAENATMKSDSNSSNAGKAIKLSVNLFDKSDPLYLDAFSIEEDYGFEDICIHGGPQSVQKIIDGKPVNMTAKEFAELLRQTPSYKGGDIRLASCSTGAGENSFAQQLSKELGVTVKAPNCDVYYAPDEGTLFVGSPYSNIGKWRTFKNGDEII